MANAISEFFGFAAAIAWILSSKFIDHTVIAVTVDVSQS